MSGAIIQEVKIFDPSNIPGYIIEVDNWISSLVSRQLQGLPPKDTSDMGRILYPHLIKYLQPLNVSGIFNLKLYDALKGDYVQAKSDGATDIKYLENNIQNFAATWPEFEAMINPRILIGTHKVKVHMHHSSGDSIHQQFKKKEYLQDIQDSEKNLKTITQDSHYKSRSISIAAKFEDPKFARIGLRYLKQLYPEMIFEEELFAFDLPDDLIGLIIESEKYLIQRLIEAEREDKELEDGFDMDYCPEIALDSSLRLLEFLVPKLKLLELIPTTVSYWAYKSDSFGFEERKHSINSFNDIQQIMKEENISYIPEVIAKFNDRKVRMDFKRTGYIFGINNSGVCILNIDREGTLEDILQKLQTI